MANKDARCLGLIGGLGPGATVHYYSELIAAHEKQARVPRLLIAQTFVARDGAQAVLIAGTDLSMVFTESNAGFPMLDCARIHIDAIMRRLLD